MEISLIVVFTVLFFCYVFFLLKVLNGLNKIEQSDNLHISDEFVSIIIPFRNESANILKSLESLEKLDYPKDKYEVIYVNDFSHDDSFEKITTANKSSNIKVISVPEDSMETAFKKIALKHGIEKSKGELIVTTDCDCIHPSAWLKTLLSCYDKNTAFISGPVEFVEDGTLFSRLQKLEFAGLILTGAGLIGSNSPTICNAANLSFRKKVYEELNGYADNLNLSSGDDEFLMQKIAAKTNYKVKFCFNKNAIARTASNRTINQFYQQRKRWASKGLFYLDKFLILKLINIYLFYLSLPFQLFAGIFLSHEFLILFLIIFTSKIFIEYQILKKGTGFFYEKSIFKVFITAELVQVFYIILTGFSGIFGNFKWKERKLKR